MKDPSASLVRLALALGLAAGVSSACRQDMHDQPKMKPLRENDSFADRRSARPLVAGTVARGTLREDAAYFTGKEGGTFLAEVPVKVDQELLLRGRERYEISCSPCHGRTGRGDGMIVQRGFRRPASFHLERLRTMPVGQLFDAMGKDFGVMTDHAGGASPRDRWAITAYIRVLQYSQYAPAADVPAEAKAALDQSVAPRAAAPKDGEK